MFISVLLITLLFSVLNGELENQHVRLDKIIRPRDLVDEVRLQLDGLRSLVSAYINSAFRSLDDVIRGVYYNTVNALTTAEISIQQEYETFNQQITTLKNLAQSAGQNVDGCLETNEPLLSQLPQNIIDSCQECLALSNREITIIQNDATYIIDTSINEVNVFEFQFDLCASDILCLEPLVTQIELATIKIPQKISIELQKAAELARTLNSSINDCMNAKIAQFVTEGGKIVANIESCVNNILP